MICGNCGYKYAHTIKIFYEGNRKVERCDSCGHLGIGNLPEFTTQEIKDNRVKYFNSIVQPYRNGSLAREYVEAHGTKGINATKEEVKNSKYQWRDLKGWETRNKSK